MGIVQGSHYRSGFVDGAVWADARGQVTPDREAIAKALYDQWRSTRPGTFTWETDSGFRKDHFYAQATAILALLNEKGNE